MTGFIGGGNMAEALIKGMTRQSGGQPGIIVSEPREERREFLENTYHVKTTPSNEDPVKQSDIIFLAVKPQIMGELLDEISPLVAADKTVVSIAAGITLSFLGSKLKTRKLIRVMPNTPALVQEAMSVMSLPGASFGAEVETVRGILMSIGKVMQLPEESIDAVTAVSGSGPAFFALFAEAIIEAGERLGLSRADCLQLAVQTFLGTAKLLDTGMPPEQLRKMVTSPGGTTEAGLKVFAERELKPIVSDALTAAYKRAGELGKK